MREKFFQSKNKTFANIFTTTASTVSDSSEKIGTELDPEIWFCFSECEASAQCIISQNFLETCGSFLSIPHRPSDRPKNYPSINSSSDLIYKAKIRHAKSEVK